MSKISNNLISCECGEEIEKRFHSGVVKAIVNEKTQVIEEWFVWDCMNCGRSYKMLKPEAIDICQQKKDKSIK
jgi:rubrerythrin